MEGECQSVANVREVFFFFFFSEMGRAEKLSLQWIAS